MGHVLDTDGKMSIMDFSGRTRTRVLGGRVPVSWAGNGTGEGEEGRRGRLGT
jgi:hypothetical protein